MAEAPRIRPSLRTAVLGLVAAAFALGYPLAAARALARWDVRPVAAVLLATGLLSLLPARRPGDLPGAGRGARAALLALPTLALAVGAEVWLRLVPAGVMALVSAVFLASLRGGGSLLQRAARRMHPYAPDFIGPYCRAATAAFAGLFALQAAALVALALRPPAAGWGLVSSLVVWLPPLLASGVEWAVRKAWFRYYGPGPLDRVLATLLPPERTARGRRSLDHIRRMRRELGLPPP